MSFRARDDLEAQAKEAEAKGCHLTAYRLRQAAAKAEAQEILRQKGGAA